MSIETTSDKAIAFYDSVTGIAFGPVFEGTDSASPQDEADAFTRWFRVRKNAEFDEKDVRDIPRLLIPFQRQAEIANEWRAFIDPDSPSFHAEAECPFDIDRDSYGIGYTGDSDKYRGDYVEATPDACGCACHERKVRSA